ncbi:MAG: coiled-coil domain-containing protein, partial [Promethearchaeota archaeon]
KRDLSVASFFTGHSSRHFIGKGDHVITVFLSDEDILPRNFEGQVRRIAFELLPKRKEKNFGELFTKSYELLEKGELDAYWQERQELEQEIGEKKEKIDDLAQKVSLLVSDRSEHLRNVEALKKEVTELYSKLEKWSMQMAELNEYNATLTSKNRELTRLTNVQKLALNQKDERINNLKAKLTDTDEIEKGAEKLIAEIKNIKIENDQFKQEIEKMNEINKKLKFQVLKSNRDNESHLETITNLKLEVKKLNDKMLGTTNEKQNLNQEVIDLKKELKVLRRECDHYQNIVKEHNLLKSNAKIKKKK